MLLVSRGMSDALKNVKVWIFNHLKFFPSIHTRLSPNITPLVGCYEANFRFFIYRDFWLSCPNLKQRITLWFRRACLNGRMISTNNFPDNMNSFKVSPTCVGTVYPCSHDLETVFLVGLIHKTLTNPVRIIYSPLTCLLIFFGLYTWWFVWCLHLHSLKRL